MTDLASTLLGAVFAGFAGHPGIACEHIAGTLTFGQLHDAACTLAARISGPRSPVMIWGHKDRSYLVAYWACLLTGRALIPVETDMPRQRVLDVVATAGVGLMLVTADNAPVDPALPLLDIRPLDQTATSFAPVPRDPEDDAYIMFSSGTSGTPKGIRVSYANLAGFICWLRDDLLADTPLQAVTGNVRYCFDVSLFELWTSWLRLIPISVLDHSEFINSRKYIARYADHQAGLWVSTPSAIQLYLRDPQFSARALPALKTFLFCGEVLPKSLVLTLQARFPGAKVINTYGPTECTVAVTSVTITPAHLAAPDALPIGHPRSGCTLSLENGQIVIAGAVVGPGYVALPEKQSAAFPEQDRYRTGDIGHCGPDGNWYFKGRADREIKLQGVRIDLNEIEDQIRNLPGVEAACVAAHTIRDTPRALNAYVCGPRSTQGLADLAHNMAAGLPPWMVPRFWFGSADMQINRNSKLDREILIHAAQNGDLRYVHD